MASLVKQNGYYYAQFYDQNRQPRRKKIPLKVRRKQKARRLLVQLEEAWAAGAGGWDPWQDGRKHRVFGWEPVEDAGEDLSRLGDATKAYLASCSHLKANTLRTYREILSLFLRHMGEEFKVKRLRPRHITEWLGTTDANDVTRRKYVKHLGYLFRYLVRKGWMEEDLSKEVPLRKVPEQAPKAMSEEEVQRLTAVIRAHSKKYQEDRRFSDYTWLALLVEANVYLGLRRGELIHLRWKHVDLEGRLLHVKNTGEFTTKSSRERTIPVCEKALLALEELQERREGKYVFHLRGRKLKPVTLSQAFLKFRRKAGLPEEFSLHSTRHTFGSWLAQRGVPVTVISGAYGAQHRHHDRALHEYAGGCDSAVGHTGF